MEENILKFRQKCIFDYTFFITTFFRSLDPLPLNNRKYSSDAQEFIISYLHHKKIKDLPLSEINQQNLESLFKYGNELLSGQYLYFNKAGGSEKKPGLRSSLKINLTGISSSFTGHNMITPSSNSSTPHLGNDSKQKKFDLEYPNTFNNKNYVPFSDSTGIKSSMKVNNKNNPSYYFKTYSKKHQQASLNDIKNECKIFQYLHQKKFDFLNNHTCFLRCYKNGILLRNGGIVLFSQLKSETFLFNAQNIHNLLNFFSILLELHKLLITHNDLKVDNIVGFDRNDVRIIDFGQSEIHSEEYYDELFFNHINKVFKTIFFALLRKHGFIS